MAVGLGEAADLVVASNHNLQELRDLLVETLRELIGRDSIKVNFEASPRLPNTASLSFKGMSEDPARLLVDVEASRGAACHSGGGAASSILIKSGLSLEDASSTLRLSVGRYTTREEILHAAKSISDAYHKLL